MPNFAKTAQNALVTIRKNGRTFAVTRPNPQLDAVTGAVIVPEEGEEPEVVAGSIVAITLQRYKGQIFGEMDVAIKEAMRVGRAKVLLSACAGDSGIVPAPNDIVAIDGSNWAVKGLSTLEPNGIPIIRYIGVIQQ